MCKPHPTLVGVKILEQGGNAADAAVAIAAALNVRLIPRRDLIMNLVW